jgi:hypothetical protein
MGKKNSGLMFPNTPKISGPRPAPGKPLGSRKLGVGAKASKGVGPRKIY